MNSPVDQIKERLSIVDVVSSYVKLEAAGINYKARCPFHNEKTPSFFVSPTRGSFHCFGCAKGGDIFTFVQEIEGSDFQGALKILAERAGVELKNYSRKDVDENEVLYRIMDEATAFYESTLEEHFKAKEYLVKRGIAVETMKSFRIGYAAPGWRNLHAHLIKKNYSESDIEKAGLIIKSPKATSAVSGSPGAQSAYSGYYDRFRERIMFPISDRAGRVIAFSGRIFPPSEDTSIAKYVNSPETILYNKSLVLFGYDKAKQSMLRHKRAVIVEGQMDLVMAHQAGTTETIAVSGTALTDQHLSYIHRFADTIILCFDSDKAGFNAVTRSAERALKMGFDIKVASLPEGQDPADLIKQDKDAWHKAIDSAVHLINFFINTLVRQNSDERTLRKEVSKTVLPYIASITDRIDQAHFIDVVARAIRINEETVRSEVERLRVSGAPPGEKPVQIDLPEKKSRSALIDEEIAGIFLLSKSLPDMPFAQERIHFESISGMSVDDLLSKIPDSRQGSLALEAELTLTDPKRMKDTLDELLKNKEKQSLQEQYEILHKKILEVEREGRPDEALVLLQECSQLLQRIQTL